MGPVVPEFPGGRWCFRLSFGATWLDAVAPLSSSAKALFEVGCVIGQILATLRGGASRVHQLDLFGCDNNNV